MSPMLYYENFKTQHEELIRQAEQERLVKLALAGQSRGWDRIQTLFAKSLIKVGSRLQGLPGTIKPALNGNSEH